MDKKLPNALAEKQERQRQETANKVLHAFIELQAQGCRLSISNLNGFYRFYPQCVFQAHVRAVMGRIRLSTAEKKRAAEPATNSPSQRRPREQKIIVLN